MADPALAHLHAPPDPRAGWQVPAFGALPQSAELDELVTRVLAPNSNHFTLDGTNTYVISAPGSGVAAVVDPGPDDPGHRARVDAVLKRRDAECGAVLVTHHHIDHAEAAQAWAASFGATLFAPTPEVAGEHGRVLVGDQDVAVGGGLHIDAVATPGHCHDHTAFRLGSGALLTGDHVLGRGTAVVAWPDGDLVAYLDSLRKVLALGANVLYPGHGPEMDGDDPISVVQYYLDHRGFREAQVLALLAEGPQTADALVPRIYAEVGQHLWPAAARSTKAALAKLAGEGRVVWDSDADPPAEARLA